MVKDFLQPQRVEICKGPNGVGSNSSECVLWRVQTGLCLPVNLKRKEQAHSPQVSAGPPSPQPLFVTPALKEQGRGGGGGGEADNHLYELQ